MVFLAKTLWKSLFHFQTDWSGNGLAGQFWQMESTVSVTLKQKFWASGKCFQPFGTGTKCPSNSDVCLLESQVKWVKKGRD